MENFTHLYSLDAFRSAFNINKLELEDLTPVTISFDPNRYIPTGSPGVTLKNSLLTNNKNRLIRVSFPFPTKRGIAPGALVDTNYKNLYPLPQKSLIKGHKIKTIDTFKKDRLRDIRNYVSTNAAITFTFSNLDAALTFWKDIPYLCSIYKHTVFFYHLAGGRKRKSATEEFIPFISFVNLPYCIPIFDYRKIDGMGICCGFIYKKRYKEDGKVKYRTITVDTLYFVLSNYQANVLYIDGVKIGTSAKIDINILNYMMRFIQDEVGYKNTPNKASKINTIQKVLSNVEIDPKEASISTQFFSNITTSSSTYTFD